MPLLVALGPVAQDAQHLAVGLFSCPAVGPGGHLVGFHLVEFVDAGLVRVRHRRTHLALLTPCAQQTGAVLRPSRTPTGTANRADWTATS